MRSNGKITPAIYSYVKTHPGAGSQEIFEALPEGSKLETVQNTLNRLERQGLLQNRGGRTNRFTPASWYINDAFVSEEAEKLAGDIYKEMSKISTFAREQYLAIRLDELMADMRNKHERRGIYSEMP